MVTSISPGDPFWPVDAIETTEPSLFSILLPILLHYISTRHLKQMSIIKKYLGQKMDKWLCISKYLEVQNGSRLTNFNSSAPTFLKRSPTIPKAEILQQRTWLAFSLNFKGLLSCVTRYKVDGWRMSANNLSRCIYFCRFQNIYCHFVVHCMCTTYKLSIDLWDRSFQLWLLTAESSVVNHNLFVTLRQNSFANLYWALSQGIFYKSIWVQSVS